MKNYRFTENWFTDDGLVILNDLDVTKELHILEIGSFEGKSTVWFLENILQNTSRISEIITKARTIKTNSDFILTLADTLKIEIEDKINEIVTSI